MPPADTPDAQKELAQRVRADERVEGKLLAFSSAANAQTVAGDQDIASVGFYDAASKSFRHLTNDQARDPRARSEVITDSSIQLVSIPDAQGKEHYYQRVAVVDGTQQATMVTANNGTIPTNGMKATAWREVQQGTDGNFTPVADGQGHNGIRFYFDGYTGDLSNKKDAQTISVTDINNGTLNRQTTAAAAFTHNVLADLTPQDRANTVAILGTYSLGASNGLAAQSVCDLEGVKAQSLLLEEPGAASLALDRMKHALSDPKSDYASFLTQLTGCDAKAVQSEAAVLDQDMLHTVSVRTLHKQGAAWETSVVAHLIPAQNAADIDTRDHTDAQREADTHWGMNHETQREISMMFGGKDSQNIFSVDQNRWNATIGTTFYQVSNEGDLAQLGSADRARQSALVKLDPYHSLTTVTNGAGRDDQLLTTDQASAMTGIAVPKETAQGGGPGSSPAPAPANTPQDAAGSGDNNFFSGLMNLFNELKPLLEAFMKAFAPKSSVAQDNSGVTQPQSPPSADDHQGKSVALVAMNNQQDIVAVQDRIGHLFNRGATQIDGSTPNGMGTSGMAPGVLPDGNTLIV